MSRPAARARGLAKAVLACAVLTSGVALAQSQAILDYAQRVGPPQPVDQAPAVGTPRFGGTLQVAVDREQPHFDPHQTTTNHVLEVLNHVAEGLLTFGADGQPIPQLAESYT